MQSSTTPATKEYTKLIFSLLGACVIALLSIAVIIFIQSHIFRLVVIPPIAYGISLCMSYIFQKSICPSTNMVTVSLLNLTVLFSTGLASLVLFLESLPILSLFGFTDPYSPVTGLPIGKESSPEEYYKATEDNKHLKVQFFSGIVKAILPVYFEEAHQTALVYFYWMFWMSLLPLYTVLGIQGIC
jgi:hypothetical protein